MNNKFTDREKGFEKKFQMDEELQFKITSRSNKYIGEWASSLLGKNEEETFNISFLTRKSWERPIPDYRDTLLAEFRN